MYQQKYTFTTLPLLFCRKMLICSQCYTVNMSNKKIDTLQSFDSVTALAKYLKISRQTLYKRLEKSSLKGRLSFTKEELLLLKKRPVKSVNVDSGSYKKIDNEKDDIVSVLREEVRAKNHTIDQLNEQLINSQKLQLMSQQHAEQLTNELHELKQIEQPKQGFWARLFGK